jgi:hypothetical protein
LEQIATTKERGARWRNLKFNNKELSPRGGLFLIASGNYAYK